jgi:hypothetical protein
MKLSNVGRKELESMVRDFAKTNEDLKRERDAREAWLRLMAEAVGYPPDANPATVLGRIDELELMVQDLKKEADVYLENLTATQKRCSELVIEVREMRAARMGKGNYLPVEGIFDVEIVSCEVRLTSRGSAQITRFRIRNTSNPSAVQVGESYFTFDRLQAGTPPKFFAGERLQLRTRQHTTRTGKSFLEHVWYRAIPNCG